MIATMLLQLFVDAHGAAAPELSALLESAGGTAKLFLRIKSCFCGIRHSFDTSCWIITCPRIATGMCQHLTLWQLRTYTEPLQLTTYSIYEDCSYMQGLMSLVRRRMIKTKPCSE